MTTNVLPRSTQPRAISIPHPEPLQSAVSQFFSSTEAADLAHEDHEAWNAVCTVLIAIVSLGLAIGIVAVLLII